ncbi:MAG: riboflavin synthase [Dehalococcoidia bacterium]|nr:riboflavin synthase [Dehalococcoidia bacterium]
MFTGIVEEIGVVKETSRDRLAFEARKVLEGAKVGDSIAVNGVCLTVVSLENHGFSVNVMPETLRCTNLGRLHYNDQVNLERALVLGGRLGGHLVLGHVDDTGEVMDVTSEETARIMRISAPAKLMTYIVDKGFIAVDGVSLTIVDLDDFSFVVSLVAYTMEHTTLGRKRPGDVVNLEADIIAKYVENLKERKRQSLNFEFLREYGFVGGIDAG